MPLGRKRLAWMVTAAMLGAALVAAAPASATFHLIKVREVFPGTVAHPDSSYVELQMYMPYQNQVQFGQLQVYTAGGLPASSFMPSSPVPNFDNQRTVLIADSGFNTVFPGVAPDFTDTNLNLGPAGGAVCWPVNSSPIDCVSWGGFTGNATLLSSAGSPFQGSGPSGAIADGSAITRSIAAGCPTLLEDADDTNNSAADFAQGTPNPRSNAAAPSERSCATTPPAKRKCKKHKKKTGVYSAKKKKCKKKKRK